MAEELLKIKEYKARFEIRIKTKNQKGESIWILLGNKSDSFEEITSQLNSILEKWGCELPKLEFAVEEKPKEFVYVCPGCGTQVPCGDMEAEKLKLFCSVCRDWREFIRREKK
jgi:hypothetical protein